MKNLIKINKINNETNTSGMEDSNNPPDFAFSSWQEFELSEMFMNTICLQCNSNNDIIFDPTEDNLIEAMCCDTKIHLENQQMWIKYYEMKVAELNKETNDNIEDHESNNN